MTEREVINKLIMEHCAKCNQIVNNDPCKECYIGVAIKIIGKAKEGKQEWIEN